MALGLDTSVVIRLLVGLPEGQARAAKRRIEEALEAGEPVYVTDLVVAETYHALHYHYELSKEDARDLLRRFIDSGVVTCDPVSLPKVITSRGGAGLVDRLIHSRHLARGATTLTFERKQGALSGAERITS
jgi:predicted nucleic-acid-binding protein